MPGPHDRSHTPSGVNARGVRPPATPSAQHMRSPAAPGSGTSTIMTASPQDRDPRYGGDAFRRRQSDTPDSETITSALRVPQRGHPRYPDDFFRQAPLSSPAATVRTPSPKPDDRRYGHNFAVRPATPAPGASRVELHRYTQLREQYQMQVRQRDRETHLEQVGYKNLHGRSHLWINMDARSSDGTPSIPAANFVCARCGTGFASSDMVRHHYYEGGPCGH